MGNPQDPSAPPSPYTAPAGPAPDLNAPAPPMNTPGLAIPQSDGAAMGPPAPAPVPPDVGVPPMLAANMPQPDASAPGNGLAAPVALSPQSGGGYGLPGFGGSPVQEARDRAARDADQNQKLAGGVQRAVDQEKQAQNAVAEVQQNQASDLGENLRQQQRELAHINATDQESQAAHAKVLAQRDTDWNNAVNAQKNMVFDPDKTINEMGARKKIFTAIAIGLSAIGSSRSIGGSGENMALKMLNDSIQHGIDAQKEAYRRAGVNIDMAGNAYARARQAGMDDHDASLAAKQSVINDHKMAADVITARYDPARIAANRDQLNAHLDSESAKTQQQFALNTQANAARAASDVFAAQQGTFNMGIAAENLRMHEEENQWQHEDRQLAAAAKANAKNAGGIAGWSGVAPTQEQQNKAAGVVGAYEAIAPLMKQAMEFRSSHARGTVFDRKAVGQAEAMHEATLLEVKNLAQLGVLSDSDISLVNKLIGPSADSVGSDDAYNGRMTQAMDYIKKKAFAQMRSYGYKPTTDSDPTTRKEDPMTGRVRFNEAEGGR